MNILHENPCVNILSRKPSPKQMCRFLGVFERSKLARAFCQKIHAPKIHAQIHAEIHAEIHAGIRRIHAKYSRRIHAQNPRTIHPIFSRKMRARFPRQHQRKFSTRHA